MADESTAAFDAEVARALDALGARAEEPALDALADPGGAARALEVHVGEGGRARILLRAAPELGAGGEGYGPTPADPVWLRIEPGSSAIRIAPLRLAESREAEAREASRVAVTSRRLPCCDAAGCAHERTHASAWLLVTHAGGGGAARRLLVAEARDLDPSAAEALVEAVAAPLARALGVPLETAAGATPPDRIAPRSAPDRGPDDEAPLGAAALARFTLRAEAEPAVLRDHANAGPRASAPRNLGVGLVLVVAAAALWIQTARSAAADQRGVALGFGAAAMLLSLAGYAFLGVARFSARYVARSSPLAWLARDRFAVAPWVSRAGAIDLRPEGRLGAALAAGELRAVNARARDDRWVVELDTDHGPIDALRTESEAVARFWRAALVRTASAIRHPGGPSARQRLRARAHSGRDTAEPKTEG